MAHSSDLALFRHRIAEALPSANIPTLLLLLYQFTGKEYWLTPPFVPVKSVWGDNDSGGSRPNYRRRFVMQHWTPSSVGTAAHQSPSRTCRKKS